MVDLSGQLRLITTLGADALGVFDLADATEPAEVASYYSGSYEVRHLDFVPTLERFVPTLERIVTVGRDLVQALTFDGAALSVEGAFSPAEEWSVEYRSVALSADGTRAVAAWFTLVSEEQPGGVALFSVGPHGALEPLDELELANGSRAVLRLR